MAESTKKDTQTQAQPQSSPERVVAGTGAVDQCS